MSKRRHNKTQAELINEVRIKKLAKRLNDSMVNGGFETHPDGWLNNKRVKINVGRYDKRVAKKGEMSQKFINFLSNYDETVHVAKYDKRKHLYSLVGIDNWMFHDTDLIDQTVYSKTLRGRIGGLISKWVQSIMEKFKKA